MAQTQTILKRDKYAQNTKALNIVLTFHDTDQRLNWPQSLVAEVVLTALLRLTMVDHTDWSKET